MRIRWNWGTGIVIAMVLFMVFILQFVYRVTFMDEYNHHLVSEDYYKDELYYQEEIDKLNNASKLLENVTINNEDNGISINFPKDKDYSKIAGAVTFQRLSNSKLDFTKDVNLENNTLFIPDSVLVSGRWNIKVYWQYNGEEYLTKKSIFY
ncbi:MAG: FixH family protein [Bacteroidota bacterium]